MPTFPPLAAALLAALRPELTNVVVAALLEAGFVEAAGGKLAELLGRLPPYIAAFIRQARDEGQHFSVYARDGAKHTGLLVVSDGKVTAAFTVTKPCSASQGGVQRDPFGQGTSRPSPGPFSRQPAPPLVQRRDLLWPQDAEEEDQRDSDAYLPGWAQS